MNLAVFSSPAAPPELHSLRIKELESLKVFPWKKTDSVTLRRASCSSSSNSSSSSPHSLRVNDHENVKAMGRKKTEPVTLRPVSCYTSSSSLSASGSPQEVDAARATATAIATAPPPPPPPPLRRPQKPSVDLSNFKPPPPRLPDNPKDLATELPFQYWYSYADLPPGIPKRRLKTALPILPSEDGASPDSVGKRGAGGNGHGNGNGNGRGSLWEAVLAVEAESDLDSTRKGSTRLLSTSHEKRGRGRALELALQEGDENAPLTREEKKKLILSCHGTSRQINVGWDGWNPNYVPLVHTYWKRSCICKIKCKGAVTLDLDSFCKLLEVETGGKVIHRVGGTLYLFRGRVYNYWGKGPKLIVRYPRVVTRFPKKLPVPENLSKEDSQALRNRGRELPALCKPGKHGVYLTLLDDIRKSFETQDLVRLNCQGFYARNMKILGSQLQALVPCELISFEFEHILMWRRKGGDSPKEDTQNPSEESLLVSNALS